MKAVFFRWPFQTFYHLLDLIVIDSWISYKVYADSKIFRKDFAFESVEEVKF